MPLLALPNELLLIVSESLNVGDLHSLILTNRRLNYLLASQFITRPENIIPALFWAAAKPNQEIIQRVLEAAHGFTVVQPLSETTQPPYVVYETSLKCSNSTVESVIACGPNLTLKVARLSDRGIAGTFQGVHWAAYMGRRALLEFLLNAGAEVDKRHPRISLPRNNKNGPYISRFMRLTPLHLAIYAGHTSVVEFLLDSGANITKPVMTWGHPKPPLYLAVREGHEHVAALLLERGASVRFGRRLEQPLGVAVTCGHEGMVRLLLEKGASVNYQRLQNGVTVLHKLVRMWGHAWDEKAERMFRLLLDNGADPHILNRSGISPWSIAYALRNVDMLRLFEEICPQQGAVDEQVAVDDHSQDRDPTSADSSTAAEPSKIGSGPFRVLVWRRLRESLKAIFTRVKKLRKRSR